MSDQAETNQLDELFKSLADAQAYAVVLEMDRKQAIDRVVPASVAKALEEIEVEIGGSIKKVNERIETLKDQIRPLVAQAGETKRGYGWRGTYVQGGPSITAENLRRLLADIPDAKKYVTFGKPSVRIEADKAKKGGA